MSESIYGTALIILWVITIGLAIVVFALTRQIGVLYERIAPAGALAMNASLKVGDPAPLFAGSTIDGSSLRIGDPSANGRSTLLFFLSPDCPICKTLLPVLRSSARAEDAWLDLIIASDGPDQDHSAFVDESRLTVWPYVVSEKLGLDYGVAKLPYAVLIDEHGKIASLGIVNSREHVESLFEAKERNVASIQDYMDQRNAGKHS